jgi:hypothetical protein
MKHTKALFLCIWPAIKWIYMITVKHWRRTIGSVFALFLAWSVVLDKLDFTTAAGALLIMWVGGYVNRRIDLSAVGKVFNESASDEKQTKADDESE